MHRIGAPNLPMAAISEQKRKYSQLDHLDWVRWWNAVNEQEGRPDKNTDFHWADIFPIRTPTVLRAVLVEPRLVGTLCKSTLIFSNLLRYILPQEADQLLVVRACWERNLDVANDRVLSQVIEEAGFSAPDIMTSANDPTYKAELRARTLEAKEAGICGVPSYRIFRRTVGEGEDAWNQHGDIVWGQDLISDVEDYIAGWESDAVAEVGQDSRDRGTNSKL